MTLRGQFHHLNVGLGLMFTNLNATLALFLRNAIFKRSVRFRKVSVALKFMFDKNQSHLPKGRGFQLHLQVRGKFPPKFLICGNCCREENQQHKQLTHVNVRGLSRQSFQNALVVQQHLGSLYSTG